LTKYIEKCKKSGTHVYLADFQFQPLKTLAKAKFKPDGVITKTFASLYDALASLSPEKD
ncbi:MAG: C4-dicarboxylic acid transporter DauA, partial [Alteromonadaceae bacterium]|nr:C4-dicarboxylic acid transporter DauA [Alteromonadaceae bacterium]